MTDIKINNREKFLVWISWNSYEELTLAICGQRYTYYGVSEGLADKLRHQIGNGWNAGKILAYLRKDFGWQKEEDFVPIKMLIADIMRKLKGRKNEEGTKNE